MRVLIVGLGSIAQKHIIAIRELIQNVEIFALRREGAEFVKIDGILDVFEPVSNLDFVIISNPTSEHANTIKKLLSLGIPMFIEKPLFNSLENKNLVLEVTGAKISTYVACNLRFLDCINFLKQYLENKRINEVNIYCGSYLPDWRPGIDFRTSYSSIKELGGGVHIDLIHEIDYLVYLFGFPNSINKTFRNNSSLDISAYDYANYLFEYDKFCVNVILNYYRRNPKRSIEIVCEEGEYRADLLSNSVFLNDALIFSSDQQIKDTYLLQMKYFLENNLKGSNNKSFNNINEAYNILKLCLED